MIGKVKDTARDKFLRLEVLERMNTLKEELEDMSTIVKEEYLDKNAADSDVIRIKERLKELEKENLNFSKISHTIAHRQKSLEHNPGNRAGVAHTEVGKALGVKFHTQKIRGL